MADNERQNCQYQQYLHQARHIDPILKVIHWRGKNRHSTTQQDGETLNSYCEKKSEEEIERETEKIGKESHSSE